MTSAIDIARQQGYSDREIADYIGEKDPRIKQAVEQGYSFDEISSFLSKKTEESPEKGALRTALQVPLGILEGTGPGLAGSLIGLAGTGEALAELEELKERLPELKKKFPLLPWPDEIDEEKYMEALQTASAYNPFTVGGIGQIAEDVTGLPTGAAKTRGQELIRTAATAGKFAPGKLLEKTIRGASVPAVSKLLTSQGLPEPAADTIAFLLSQIGGRKGAKAPKMKKEVTSNRKGPPPGDLPPSGLGKPPGGEIPPAGPGFAIEVEKLPSGLTKPRAMGEKRPELGIITPAQQEKAIEGLNKEAAKIASDKFQETFPTAKKVMEGANLEAEFQKGFGALESQAAKANPNIDIAPFTKFLREEQAKYRGIPTLDRDAKKIVKWIENFRESPTGELKNLLKIYRSVNRELKGIYERAKISGIPDHYVNFLTRANQEIASSIRQTLPENSLWMKRFDQLNKEFKNYQDAKKVSSILKPILGGEPTAANLRKIARDPKTQRILELKMGKKAADEIIQIAKDLEAATKSIGKISSSKIKELDDIYPIPLLLAGMKIPGIGYVTKKIAEAARRIYGTNLIKPSTRKIYREAVEAAGKGDIAAYKKATDALRKEQGLLGLQEPKLLEYKPSSQPPSSPPQAKSKPKSGKEKIKTSSASEIRERLLEEKRREKISSKKQEKPDVLKLEKKPKLELHKPSDKYDKVPIKDLLIDTRGQGRIFHGSPVEISQPSSTHYTSSNYYGKGFYTTDASDIALGYTRSSIRNRRSGFDVLEKHNHHVYEVFEIKKPNLYDMEKPLYLNNDVKIKLEELGTKNSLISDALNYKPKNLRELYNEIRYEGTNLGYSKEGIQESYEQIKREIEKLGYDGFRHTGGLQTNKKPHEVKIYFEPEKFIKLKKLKPF